MARHRSKDGEHIQRRRRQWELVAPDACIHETVLPVTVKVPNVLEVLRTVEFFNGYPGARTESDDLRFSAPTSCHPNQLGTLEAYSINKWQMAVLETFNGVLHNLVQLGLVGPVCRRDEVGLLNQALFPKVGQAIDNLCTRIKNLIIKIAE